MIDIDYLLDKTIDIKFKGKVYKIKQPTAKTTKKIARLEAGIDKKNYLDVRTEITKLVLDNNTEGKIFTSDEIDEIPVTIQNKIQEEIANLVKSLDESPN